MVVIAIIGIIATIFMPSSGTTSSDVGLYGYLRSKDITGNIVSVTSAMPENGAVIAKGPIAFKVAVLIQTKDGEMISFSSDDSQWASLRGDQHVGKCVTATVYPYPPWNLGKAGTLHSGRMIKFTNEPCHYN